MFNELIVEQMTVIVEIVFFNVVGGPLFGTFFFENHVLKEAFMYVPALMIIF